MRTLLITVMSLGFASLLNSAPSSLSIRSVSAILSIPAAFAQASDPLSDLTKSTKKDPKLEDLFSEEERESARTFYRERCARCHGLRGDGRGSLASYLSPRPTDLTRPDWLRSTSFEQIKVVILGGGGRLGKSVLMPANPKLREEPRLLAALIYYVIDFAPKEPQETKSPAAKSDSSAQRDSNKRNSSKRNSSKRNSSKRNSAQRSSTQRESNRRKRPKRGSFPPTSIQ